MEALRVQLEVAMRNRAGVVGDQPTLCECWSSGIGRVLEEVAGSISNACCEGVSAVGGEVGCGSEGPAAPINGGIAEEGLPGIDAECVSGAEVAAKGACEGGSAVVGASVVGKVALFEADVVGDACDGAARAVGAAESRISRRVLEARPRFPAASATRAVKEWVRLVARLDLGVKDQLRPLTEALPRKDFPE